MERHVKKWNLREKRWEGDEPTTTTGGSKSFTTVGVTVTGTGTLLTMTTNIVTTPTTLMIAPSGTGPTTYVVVMPALNTGLSTVGGLPTPTTGVQSYITVGTSLYPLPGYPLVTNTPQSSLVSPSGVTTSSPEVVTVTTGFNANEASAAQAAATATNSDSGSGSKTAAIIGATLGGAAFLVGLIAVIFAFATILKRRNKKEDEFAAMVAASQYAPPSRRNTEYAPSRRGTVAGRSERGSQYPRSEAHHDEDDDEDRETEDNRTSRPGSPAR